MSERPRLLLVGPYEKDSDFDQIFLLITERYLRSAEVLTAAPFGADMTAQLARRVHAYGSLLEAEEFGVIWTVGGGIEGATQQFAFRRAASPELYQEFERSSSTERQRMVSLAFGDAPLTNPYIPSPLDYPLNAGAVTVLNSVGISHILDDPSLRKERIDLLRGLTFVSVRDKESSNLLAALGVSHRLAPDVVHAVNLLHPGQRDRESEVAVVQIFADTLAVLGPRRVAHALVRSTALRGLPIRVVHLVTFWGEQSVGRSEELVWYVKQTAPGTDIELVASESPIDLVDQIRHARVVICDDQHVRIAASAYKIPRVLLWSYHDKSSRYHRFWDPDMPYDVLPDDLDEAIGKAMSAADDPTVIEHSEKLTQLAHDNLEYLANQVMTAVRTQTSDEKAQRMRMRREHRDRP
jgi:polysaccharide pyruvyl transferase WcaK-like protein